MASHPLDALRPLFTLAARLLIAPLFLIAGYGKLTGKAGTIAYMQAHGVPLAELLVWPAAIAEVGGGLLLLLGWQARWAALVLAAFTAAATPLFHAFWSEADPTVAYQQALHFWKNLAIMGGLLFAAAHGPGRFALDRQ